MATTNKGIYYPNNYSNVADVPEDMKKLAESVDTVVGNLDTNKVDKVDGKGLSTNDYTNEDKAKLDSLENYDDTEIKQDIEDIQAKDESQDTEIDKQSDLIQKLKDNCINVTTEEATSLHVTDASILPAKLDVRGNHSQETTKGIQILENTNDGTTGWGWSTSPSNVGVIKEVSYLGTKACKFSLPENSYAWKFLWRNVNRGKLKNNTTYTIQFDAKTNYNENITIAIQNMAAQNKLVNFGTININGEKRVKVVANSNTIEILDQILYIYADNIANASGRELIITNLILIEGDYSNTDIEWEKYTGLQGSPSLDYPSPVRAVGDNVNMFNVWESGTISNSGNIESSDIAIRTADFISVKSNTSYTYKIYDETISNIALFEYDENSNFIKVMYNLNTEQTIVTSETTRKVKMRIVSTDLSTKMKFEEGTEATSYSPYGQGSVEIKKLTENVIDLSKSVALYNTEITEIDKENGIIKVHRTNTQDPSIQIFCNLPAGQYTMLHNSHNFGQVSVYGKNKIVDIGSEKYKIFNATENITDIRIYSESELPTDYEINFSDIILVAGNIPREDIEYVKYQESSYFLPIQKPMLLGDYFDVTRGKEVHKWIERELTGTENITLTDTVNGIAQFTFSQFYDGDYDTGSVNINALSNYYKGVPYQSSWLKDNSIALAGGYTARIMTSEYSTVEEFKQMLAGKYAEGNPVRIYYKLIKPKELDLTEEQKAVLQQLSELELFAGTNNIITAESLALMQMQYIADTQSYIDSKLNNINQQILELAGGN